MGNGTTNTGAMVAATNSAGTLTAVATNQIIDTDPYIVCMGF